MLRYGFQAQACVIIYMSADFDFPDKNPLGIYCRVLFGGVAAASATNTMQRNTIKGQTQNNEQAQRPNFLFLSR